MDNNHYTIKVTQGGSLVAALHKPAVEAGQSFDFEAYIKAELDSYEGLASYRVQRGARLVMKGEIDLGEASSPDTHEEGCDCLPCFTRRYEAKQAAAAAKASQMTKREARIKALEAIGLIDEIRTSGVLATLMTDHADELADAESILHEFCRCIEQGTVAKAAPVHPASQLDPFGIRGAIPTSR